MGYGQTFFVGTPDGAGIASVNWVRLTSVTHATNMDQRMNRLGFSQASGGLNVTAPSSSFLCPPGPYMLFLLYSNGVPSPASIVRISTAGGSVPAAPTGLSAAAVSATQVNLAWSDNATHSSGIFTVKGSGADIWGTSDGFRFVHKTLSGNGELVARVASVQNTNTWAKAGVMIRESLTAGSKHAMMVITPGNGASFQRRTSTGGSSAHTTIAGITAPHYVRIVRNGSTFTGYRSTNGVSWTLVGSATINMATNVYIGLAVTSHNNPVLCTSTFDNVR